MLDVALHRARGDAVDDVNCADLAFELGDHLLDDRGLGRVVVPELRGEPFGLRGRGQRLHVEAADLHLLAVEVHGVDLGALAEEELRGDGAGDAVRAAEDQHGGVVGDLRPHGVELRPLGGEELGRHAEPVLREGTDEGAAVDAAEGEFLEDFEIRGSGHRHSGARIDSSAGTSLAR